MLVSPAMKHPRPSTVFAVVALTVMSTLALLSSNGDSAIVDEVPHLAAGYTYVTRGDMRLNPEHPPLIKDLAGLSVLLWSRVTRTQIHVPIDRPAWATETNGQWQFGPAFLYQANHDSQAMLFWGRLPMVVIFAGFGWWLCWWCRRRWGAITASLILFFYAASPTMLAHARFVTTDLAATAGFFASFAAFLYWIERPNWHRTLSFGVVFGVAQLTKFSLLLLLPVFPLLILINTLTSPDLSAWRLRLRMLVEAVGKYCLVLGIAFGLIVTPIYVLHTMHYPIAKQQQDVAEWQSSFASGPLATFVTWSVDKQIFRAMGHYLTGVLLVQHRSHFGSTTSFLGTVDNIGRTAYFPTVYVTKEPLTVHILSVIALLFAGGAIVQSRRNYRKLPGWMHGHLADIGAVTIIGWYWWTSLHSQLNIGIRHILPTLPFVYLLISRGIVHIGHQSLFTVMWRRTVGVITLGALFIWQLVSVLSIHPSYLAYYNALAGGPTGGRRVAADSNLDWGQDLYRLADYVQRQQIPSIHLDYFGGGDPSSILPGIAHEYHVQNGPVSGWLAISLTYLTNEQGRPGPRFPKEANRYAWLDAYQPVTTIGHSIVVYNIPN